MARWRWSACASPKRRSREGGQGAPLFLSFAKILSERNRELLALIAERTPDSIDALAAASGRAKSNLSRTLRTMERYGLVLLEKSEGRKLRPTVTFDTVELKLTVAA